MRITEVQESHRNEEYLELNDEEDDDDEYITEDEFDDAFDDESKPQKPVNFRSGITNVVQAFTPGRIRQTIRSTSSGMIEQSKSVARTAGNLAWIFTTSMLLVGLPVLYAYDREKNSALQAGQLAPLDAASQ